jgi:hypothetical protein
MTRLDRLGDVVARFVAGDADGVEAAHLAPRRALEVRPEAVVGADEAARLAVVAGSQRHAIGGNHIGGGGARAPVHIDKIVIDRGNPCGVLGGGQQPAHRGMQGNQRGEEFVAVERGLERGGVALGAHGRGLLQRGDPALHRQQPGQPAEQQQAGQQGAGKAIPARAGSGRMHGTRRRRVMYG